MGKLVKIKKVFIEDWMIFFFDFKLYDSHHLNKGCTQL